MANRDVLAAISNEGQRGVGSERLPMVPRRPAQPETLPVYGPLEVPEGQEEGPAGGLTLDGAIEILVRNNIDLRTKAFEIPKARADVLTASLRANPMVFASVGSVPYGSYSPTRPGETNYSATVIYPFDVSHKRLVGTEVATRAEQRSRPSTRTPCGWRSTTCTSLMSTWWRPAKPSASPRPAARGCAR